MKIPGTGARHVDQHRHEEVPHQEARAVRRDRRGRPVGGRRHRQQVGEQRQCIVDVERCRTQVSFDGRPPQGVVLQPVVAEDPLPQVIGDRIEGTLRVEGRALQLDHPDGAVVARLVDDDARQPRLADARLAADADHLAVAGDDLLPPVA